MAFPFMPMTDEMLKKLSRAAQYSDPTINSRNVPAVFVSQEFKSALELNKQHPGTNQPDNRTNNQY